MPVEQGPTRVEMNQRARHVPKHRRGGRHRHDPSRPEQSYPSHSPSSTLKIPGVVSHEILPQVDVMDGRNAHPKRTAYAEDGSRRVSESLQRLERREEFDRLTKERENAGCVIRAVESAFHAKATIPEVEERLTDVRDMLHKNITGEDTYENFRAEDIRRVTAYYERLKTHTETPLGKAMRDYTLSLREMTKQDIQEAVLDGKKVLASTLIKYKDKEVQHLMHVDYFSSTGRFVDVSDNGSVEVNAPSYFCFVFDKAPEVGDQQTV
jgi:hypothetical protein